MTVNVHPEAGAELAAAVEWYEERRVGLGDEFERDVYDAFEVILDSPSAWQRWPGLDRVRAFPLDRFPYLVPYVVRGTIVVVLAGAHAKRRPGYWQSRAKND